MKNILALILSILTNTSFAQTSANIAITVPSYALLDVSPNNTAFNLNLVAPTEAGNITTINPTNSSKTINFTSAVAPGTTRKISAQISGTLPAGVNLKLLVSPYTGAGGGTLGTSSGTLNLNGSAQIVINNIGGAFTGDGTNNGYKLNYTLELLDFSLLRSKTTTFSIIYTLADN